MRHTVANDFVYYEVEEGFYSQKYEADHPATSSMYPQSVLLKSGENLGSPALLCRVRRLTQNIKIQNTYFQKIYKDPFPPLL